MGSNLDFFSILVLCFFFFEKYKKGSMFKVFKEFYWGNMELGVILVGIVKCFE